MRTLPFVASVHIVRRGLGGLAVAGLLSLALAAGAAAQDIAAAGNGGTADASADGGSVSVGDVNSGLNSGSSISVGDVGSVVCDKWGHCWTTDGSVAIDGGDVSNATHLGISVDGGVAIADASGGDLNVAVEADDD